MRTLHLRRIPALISHSFIRNSLSSAFDRLYSQGVASPAYRGAGGVPQKPDDLTQHSCLVHARPDATSAAWPFLVEGKPISVRVQ